MEDVDGADFLQLPVGGLRADKDGIALDGHGGSEGVFGREIRGEQLGSPIPGGPVVGEDVGRAGAEVIRQCATDNQVALEVQGIAQASTEAGVQVGQCGRKHPGTATVPVEDVDQAIGGRSHHDS